MGRMWPRMATNVAQHKIVNLLKTFVSAHRFPLVFVYVTCGPETPLQNVLAHCCHILINYRFIEGGRWKREMLWSPCKGEIWAVVPYNTEITIGIIANTQRTWVEGGRERDLGRLILKEHG